MKGLYFNNTDNAALSDQLDHHLFQIKREAELRLIRADLDLVHERREQKLMAQYKHVNLNEFIKQLEQVDLQKLFVSDRKSFLSEYKQSTDSDDRLVIKTKEEPPRYIIKQKLLSADGNEAVLSLAFTISGGQTTVSNANVLLLTNKPNFAESVATLADAQWKKSAVNDEQLLDWAAAEYFIHHIYTDDPMDAGKYSRILDLFGADCDGRRKLHDQNPLFFPINRLLHSVQPSFTLSGLTTIQSLQAKLTPKSDRAFTLLAHMLDETHEFQKRTDGAVHERVTQTALLHNEYAARLAYLKKTDTNLSDLAQCFIDHPIVGYGRALAMIAPGSHLALSESARDAYLDATNRNKRRHIFTDVSDSRYADSTRVLHEAAFLGHFNVIEYNGHSFENFQLVSAYHIYKAIILDHFEEYLQILTAKNIFDPSAKTETPGSLQIARFLLLNPELSEKVSKANPQWYYALMMRFSRDLLMQYFPLGVENREVARIIGLMSGKLTDQLARDCHAAYALLQHGRRDESHFLTKHIIENYGALELNKNALFSELVIQLNDPSLLLSSKDNEATATFAHLKTYLTGRVNYCFSEDFNAVKALLAANQFVTAQSVLLNMYSVDYYSALKPSEQRKLNTLSENYSDDLGRDCMRNILHSASKAKMNTMSYWAQIKYLYSDAKSIFDFAKAVFHRFVGGNTIIMNDWDQLHFNEATNGVTLADLKEQSLSKPATVSVNSHRQIAQQLKPVAVTPMKKSMSDLISLSSTNPFSIDSSTEVHSSPSPSPSTGSDSSNELPSPISGDSGDGVGGYEMPAEREVSMRMLGTML